MIISRIVVLSSNDDGNIKIRKNVDSIEPTSIIVFYDFLRFMIIMMIIITTPPATMMMIIVVASRFPPGPVVVVVVVVVGLSTVNVPSETSSAANSPSLATTLMR